MNTEPERVLSAAEIEAQGLRRSELRRAVVEAFRLRDESREDWEAWEVACTAWHAFTGPLDELWEPSYLSRLRSGDFVAVENAIRFLEVDPRYHRSGYLKEKLIRHLKPAILDEAAKERLRGVILKVACGGPRREVRDFSLLAWRVSNPAFESELERLWLEDPRAFNGKPGWIFRRIQSLASQA